MKNKNDDGNKIQYLPIFMSIGLSLGMAIGAGFGSIPIGMCFGMAIGVCLGSALDAKNRKEEDDATQESEEETDL